MEFTNRIHPLIRAVQGVLSEVLHGSGHSAQCAKRKNFAILAQLDALTRAHEPARHQLSQIRGPGAKVKLIFIAGADRSLVLDITINAH